MDELDPKILKLLLATSTKQPQQPPEDLDALEIEAMAQAQKIYGHKTTGRHVIFALGYMLGVLRHE